MTVYLVARAAYHRGMDDGLPHPSEALSLAEIDAEVERVITMLRQGGAVIVLSTTASRPRRPRRVTPRCWATRR